MSPSSSFISLTFHQCFIMPPCHSTLLRSFWILILQIWPFLCHFSLSYRLLLLQACTLCVFFRILGIYWSEQGRRQSPQHPLKTFADWPGSTYMNILWLLFSQVWTPSIPPHSHLSDTSPRVMRNPILCVRRYNEMAERIRQIFKTETVTSSAQACED